MTTKFYIDEEWVSLEELEGAWRDWKVLKRKMEVCKGGDDPSTSDEVNYPLVHDDCPIQEFCRPVFKRTEHLNWRIERMLRLNSMEKQNVTDRDIKLKDIKVLVKEGPETDDWQSIGDFVSKLINSLGGEE